MLAVHPMLTALAPELALVIGAALILMLGLATSRTPSGGPASPHAKLTLWLALLTVAVALYLAWRNSRDLIAAALPPMAPLVHDPLVWYVRLMSLSVGILLLLVNHHVPESHERSEFTALTLVSLAGINLVVLANDLTFLFLALELVSIPTYILIALSRRDIRAQEATGKYFFLGAFASALTLYGFSFLYGAAGTMRLFGGRSPGDSLWLVLSGAPTIDPLVALGLVLSLAGLAFKIAAVPLHFYVADVYQGAASPIAGLLGFVPKFAGFLAVIRLLSVIGWALNPAVFWLLWVLAAATMFVGNALALMQHNVKRMLAYSSIAHSGYMLVALVAASGSQAGVAAPMQNGLAAILFYAPLYGVMNLGAFASLACFRKTGPAADDSFETLQDLAGSAQRHPWIGLALSVSVLGLMGFPLTAGFLGKVYIFSATLSADAGAARHTAMIVLVVLGVINSAIGAAYYLRILAVCYLRHASVPIALRPGAALRLGLALCALIVLAAFFRPVPLLDSSTAAVARVCAPAVPSVSAAAAWTPPALKP